MIARYVLAASFAWVIAGCDKIDSQREALENGDRKVKVGAYREAISRQMVVTRRKPRLADPIATRGCRRSGARKAS
jgi:hypothetical protein